MECSWRLCPSPGMYAVTSMPLESRTRATLRSAELGFLGVMVLTCRQTPRFCGQPCMAGCFGRDRCGLRGRRTTWLIVGMSSPDPLLGRVRSKIGVGYSGTSHRARPGEAPDFWPLAASRPRSRKRLKQLLARALGRADGEHIDRRVGGRLLLDL